MKIALYARISTAEQSLEPQLMELRTAAKARSGGPHAIVEITDTISGSKASREGLDRLMAMVAAREVDVIMVVKLDRLARSLANFVNLTATLEENGVALIIPGQGIDTSDTNPCGAMIRGVLAVIAQFERSLIQERTRAGLAVARSRGKVLGRVSKLMPAPAGRRVIVEQWMAEGGDLEHGYAELGRRLGGVSAASAWREARKYAQPAAESHANIATESERGAAAPSVEMD